MNLINLSRRSFLQLGILAGSSLLLGGRLGSLAGAAEQEGKSGFSPNIFLHIAATNAITVFVNKVELGQGVSTALPMLIAEELEADWTNISVAQAPLTAAYDYPSGKSSTATVRSASIRSEWERLRQMGAAARFMLIEAAARTWQVDPVTCSAENGEVIHQPTGQRLTYGDLAVSAGTLAIPENVTLKDAADFKIIGTAITRLNDLDKCCGKTRFGLDTNRPDLAVALIARPPYFGGVCISYNDTATLAIPGVKKVVPLDSGIAVVADGYFTASRGREALQIDWDETTSTMPDSRALAESYQALAETDGTIAVNRGDFLPVLRTATRTMHSSYRFPYLAHAPMEPLSCIADVRPDSCEIWAGTQLPALVRDSAATMLDLPSSKIVVHNSLCGGSFGRRATSDCHFIKEAVQLSKLLQTPVKVYWSREDDIKGGYYRPASLHQFRAALGDNDLPSAWHHRVIGQPTPEIGGAVELPKDKAVQLAAGINTSYRIPHFRVDCHPLEHEIPVLCWRGGSHVATAYAQECFLDELARAAGYDPYYYRRLLLDRQAPEKKVIELAAKKAGWGKELPKGRARGIAMHSFRDSIIAAVAEVSLYRNGGVKVHRITCGVDCGQVVHPDLAAAQIESAVIFALTALLYGEITFRDGQVQQSNFDNYPLLTLPEAPAVDVHFIASSRPPGGVGEIGVPPLGPAVANAIFALTGQPMHTLPLTKERIRAAMGLDR